MPQISDTGTFLLAVETAIGGGSLAIFDGDQMVDHTSAGESIARAENLLSSIDKLLDVNKIRKSNIASIAVSTGPGSYTGLRIGIATILGLGKALGIETVGIPLFRAIETSITEDRAYLVAVPMGRNDICFEVKDSAYGVAGLRVGTVEDIKSTVDSDRLSWILTHSDLIDSLRSALNGDIQITDLGGNMAGYIGRSIGSNLAHTAISPIYVQNPRFE